MQTLTETIIRGIERAVRDGAEIAPCTFTAQYPRANVSAAFRAAKARGIITVSYRSVVGTPVYRKALRLVAVEGGASC